MANQSIDNESTINSDKQLQGTEEGELSDSGRSRSPSPDRDRDRERERERERSTPGRCADAPKTEHPELTYEDEETPPLPNEAVPEDDGWEPVFDTTRNAYYFYNRFTHATQWENPRVPEANAAGSGAPHATDSSGAPGTTSSGGAPGTRLSSPPKRLHGGYNPAIHGDYDPNADYALEAQKEEEEAAEAAAALRQDPTMQYAGSAHFNRFTGRFQTASINPENYNDENKSKRQMSAFFDVDAAANSHDGRSLKAERQAKKLSKQELKAFKEKRREKKEEKRRAWLKD